MKIVVIGGCTEPSEEGCLKCCEIFEDGDGNNGVLIEKVLNNPRRGSAIFTNNGFIYVIGGCKGPRKHLKSIEKIDTKFKATIIEAKIDEGSCFAYCEAKNSLFIAGGFNGIECLNSVFLGPSPNSLEHRSQLPTPLKNSAACPNPFNSNSVLVFDFTCTMDGILPYRIEGHTATLIDSSIFLIGGYDGISPISSIAKFDKNGIQILPQKLEIARENHCTIFLKAKRELWIIGGWNGNESLNSIERFKIAENGSLEKLSNFSLKKARQKAGAVVID